MDIYSSTKRRSDSILRSIFHIVGRKWAMRNKTTTNFFMSMWVNMSRSQIHNFYGYIGANINNR